MDEYRKSASMFENRRKRGRPRTRNIDLSMLKRRIDRSESSTTNLSNDCEWQPSRSKVTKLKSVSKKNNSRQNSVSQSSEFLPSTNNNNKPNRSARKRHCSNSSYSSSSSSAISNELDSNRPVYNYYSHLAKKYDIDNIVIPYDMASSNCRPAEEVTKNLQVPIPQWRELSIEAMSSEERSNLDVTSIEDLDERRYEVMHEAREAKEKNFAVALNDKCKKSNKNSGLII